MKSYHLWIALNKESFNILGMNVNKDILNINKTNK